MAVTAPFVASFLLLIGILAPLQFAGAQIHWNRGWGAGGSLGKRTAHPFRQLVSRLWSHSPSAFKYEDGLPIGPRDQLDLAEFTLPPNLKNGFEDRKEGEFSGDKSRFPSDEVLANCSVDTANLASLISKILQEETAKIVECRKRQITADWAAQAQVEPSTRR